ncbi:hypothetical protein MRX96_016082 [Rhipicephalus microplus]
MAPSFEERSILGVVESPPAGPDQHLLLRLLSRSPSPRRSQRTFRNEGRGNSATQACDVASSTSCRCSPQSGLIPSGCGKVDSAPRQFLKTSHHRRQYSTSKL